MKFGSCKARPIAAPCSSHTNNIAATPQQYDLKESLNLYNLRPQHQIQTIYTAAICPSRREITLHATPSDSKRESCSKKSTRFSASTLSDFGSPKKESFSCPTSSGSKREYCNKCSLLNKCNNNNACPCARIQQAYYRASGTNGANRAGESNGMATQYKDIQCYSQVKSSASSAKAESISEALNKYENVMSEKSESISTTTKKIVNKDRGSTKKLQNDKQSGSKQSCEPNIKLGADAPYGWFPSACSARQTDYMRFMECELEELQQTLFSITSHMARMQFRLRQAKLAEPGDERDCLLQELEDLIFGAINDCENDEELPSIKRDLKAMGDVKGHQNLLLRDIHNRLPELEEHVNDNLSKILRPNTVEVKTEQKEMEMKMKMEEDMESNESEKNASCLAWLKKSLLCK